MVDSKEVSIAVRRVVGVGVSTNSATGCTLPVPVPSLDKGGGRR